MRRKPFFTLLIGSLLCYGASSTPAAVSSTAASYNGNALVLSGKVTLDHGLGKMQAEEAELQKQEEPGSDFPFKMIHLAKDVLLSLKNSGNIQADLADLDFTSLKGHLKAKEGAKVTYTDYFKKKISPENKICLVSNTLDLSFAKEDSSQDKTFYGIDEALAKGETQIIYGNLFVLDADHALYRKALTSQDKTASKEFQGILSAYAKSEEETCHLKWGDDRVDAKMIDIDTLQSKLFLVHPKGSLATSLLQQKGEGRLAFEANHLTWDQKSERMVLKGNVLLQDPLLGTLNATQELHLTHQLIKGKRQLQTAIAYGPTTLVYQNSPKNASHTLTCFGTTRFDHAHKQATCESPTVEGLVPQEAQLHYEDGDLSFYSDVALFEYEEEEQTLTPTSFTLKGNVRLLAKKEQNQGSYGIADRLHYAPETHTLILTAAPGKKVLFWDAVNHLSISAKEVHILQDPATQERKVQGIGSLRMTFDPQENALFKHLFPGIDLHE